MGNAMFEPTTNRSQFKIIMKLNRLQIVTN